MATRIIFYTFLIILGLIFYSSGMGKLYANHLFPGLIGPVWLEEKLAEHHLGLFARFIAWTQVLCGLLLLTYRFRAIGYLILTPMLVNIFFVTMSLNWRGTPYVIGLLLCMNIFLYWYDRQLFYSLIEKETVVPFRNQAKPWVLMILGMAFIGTILSVSLSLINLKLGWGLSALSLISGIWVGWKKG